MISAVRWHGNFGDKSAFPFFTSHSVAPCDAGARKCAAVFEDAASTRAGSIDRTGSALRRAELVVHAMTTDLLSLKRGLGVQTPGTEADFDIRVAVVVTCYNQARFLPEAVESVLAQSHTIDEIIVVDDGSTDDTAAVARRYGGVSYVYQHNRGLAAARNTGLRQATADHILFLDSDDILKPKAVEYCLAAFDAQPEAALVYGGFWAVDEKRIFLSEVVPGPQNDHFASFLRGNPIGMHGTVLYKTHILKRLKGFDESLQRCEDYDLYLRLSKDYPIGIYRGIAAEYRQHGDNMTRDAPVMLHMVRSVLARYEPMARTSAEWRAAYAAGHKFWSMYYGWGIVELLADEIAGRRRLGRIASLIAAGVRRDRRFLLRVARRVLRSLNARLAKPARRKV